MATNSTKACPNCAPVMGVDHAAARRAPVSVSKPAAVSKSAAGLLTAAATVSSGRLSSGSPVMRPGRAMMWGRPLARSFCSAL